MSRLGFVYDVYDDIDGTTFTSIINNPNNIPSLVKTAHRLSFEEISQLPDDNFALVLVDEGKKFKKYATIDAGNTILSVMYLIKQAHLLPEEAVKIASENLIEACNYHNIPIPQELKKIAKAGVPAKSQFPFGSKIMNQKQDPQKDTPGQTTDNPQLGNADPNDDVKLRTNFHGTPGTNFKEAPIFSQKEKVKTQAGEEKRAYVDITGWQPTKTASEYTPTRTLLRGKYPVDSLEQIKLASDYFTSNVKNFRLEDRREYCIKLAQRMKELDVKIPENIERYSSNTYAADVDTLVEYRRNLVPEEFHASLDVLLEKRAQVRPETFANALLEFDNMTGINYGWDSDLPDPYFTTFGPSFNKLAAKEWSWDGPGFRVSLGDLENLARNGKSLVKKQFGERFMEEFSKNPKTFFDALPNPNKVVLGRLATDRHAGTATE